VIADPLFYLAAIPAVLLNSISKGGFGGAFGGIAVPLMAIVVSPPLAAAIMLPLLCSADLFGMRRYYGRWDAPILRTMLIGGIAGVGFGALSFGSLSQNALRLLVGMIAIAFSIYYFAANTSSRQSRPPSMRSGIAWASLSGYTSFVAHAGGPPAMAYLIPQGLDRMVYVATINSFFMTMNLIKLVPYTLLGQFTVETLSTSLALLPLVPVGVKAGFWLQRRINNQRFYQIAQACLLASGMQLIWMSMR
jgi:uncharacterized protein